MKVEIGKVIDINGKVWGSVIFVGGKDRVPNELFDGEGKPKITTEQLIDRIAHDDSELEKAGFGAPCNHPDCPIGTTMWQHLLYHLLGCFQTDPGLFAALGQSVNGSAAPLPASTDVKGV